MKFEINTNQFLNAVSSAEKVSGKKLSLPILNAILIEAKKDTVSVRATNLDIGIDIKVGAKVHSDGVCAVSGGVLSSVLAALLEESVLIKGVQGNMVVDVKSGKTTVKSNPPEDFPIIPRVESGVMFSIHPHDLVFGLKSVMYAAAVSSMKQELSSVYMLGKNGKLTFAATDSFRLAEKTLPFKSSKDVGPILVPAKNVTDIVKVLDGAEEPISVSITENQISFESGRVYLTSRLVHGAFPDYHQIIPKKASTEAVALKQDLVSALRKTSLFSNTFNQVRFSIGVSGKELRIESSNPDVGETTAAVEAAVSGEDISVSFNQRYVSDCFQSIPADSVSLSLNGASKPMIIRGVGDNSFLYLVMPMNR